MKTINIPGIWDECSILDAHIKSSVLIGENQWGYNEFNNKRTELGELVYRLKYRADRTATIEIVKLIEEYLNYYENKVNLLIPVPPSNKSRKFQPVYQLTKAFAEYLEKDYKLDLLDKIGSEQAKDGKDIANTIKKKYNLEKKTNVLLIDDLLGTGNTLKECCKVLRMDENIEKIYCLVMTRTRTR